MRNASRFHARSIRKFPRRWTRRFVVAPSLWDTRMVAAIPATALQHPVATAHLPQHQAILHPRPATLHPRPATLHPLPATLHPRPATLHPRPVTHHPHPVTLLLRLVIHHRLPVTTLPQFPDTLHLASALQPTLVSREASRQESLRRITDGVSKFLIMKQILEMNNLCFN